MQPLSLPDPDPFEFRPVSGEPRAYRLTYTRTLHEGMAQAMQAKREDGRPILLERDGLQGEGEGGEENGNRRTYGEDDGGGLRLRDLPPPNLPPKDQSPH